MSRQLKSKQEKTRLRAFVATPAYDGKVECNYSQSLAEAAFTAPLFGIGLTASVMGNGAFIDLARNIFAKRFLEDFPDCTHLFFIDADLKFEPRMFIGLMQANKPICAGAYRRRQEPEDYPVIWSENPNGGGLWVEEEGWLMCDRVATGFLCIRRDVIEEMAKDAPKITIHGQKGPVPWLFHTSFNGSWAPQDGDKFIGEDYGFCDDYVKKYDKRIPVWADADFTHGGLEGNFHRWLAKKIEEEDKKKVEESVAA